MLLLKEYYIKAGGAQRCSKTQRQLQSSGSLGKLRGRHTQLGGPAVEGLP